MNQDLPLLIELHYLPNIHYFSKLLFFKETVIEQHENYGKRSFRNRTIIATANGPLRLTIPLAKGKNQQRPIRKVKIAYEEPWQKKHWHAIQSAYGNAPFFEFYEADLHPAFEEKTEFLFEFNLKLLQKILSILPIQPHLQFSQSYVTNSFSRFYDFRNRLTPAASYQPTEDNFFPVRYQQVFAEKNGFLPNLSILDLIFCTGPEALSIIKQSFKNQ